MNGWLAFPIIWNDAPIQWLSDSPLGYDGFLGVAVSKDPTEIPHDMKNWILVLGTQRYQSQRRSWWLGKRRSNMAAKSQNIWRFLNGKSVAIDRFHPTTSQYLE